MLHWLDASESLAMHTGNVHCHALVQNYHMRLQCIQSTPDGSDSVSRWASSSRLRHALEAAMLMVVTVAYLR